MLKKFYLLFIFALLIFISACKGEPVSQPTTDPGQLETQVAEQVAATLTQIALNQPTVTMTSPPVVPATEIPSPTITPLPPTESLPILEPASPTPIPPSPTSTIPAPTVTIKPSSTATPLPFACQVVKQVPEDGKIFKPDTDFDAIWTVKNVGAALWEETDVDYRYKSGDKIHQIEIYDLSKSTKPGESVDLLVDMKAPDKEGKYKTTWVLGRGDHLICTLTLEINVKK